MTNHHTKDPSRGYFDRLSIWCGLIICIYASIVYFSSTPINLTHKFGIVHFDDIPSLTHSFGWQLFSYTFNYAFLIGGDSFTHQIKRVEGRKGGRNPFKLPGVYMRPAGTACALRNAPETYDFEPESLGNRQISLIFNN